MSLVSTSTIKEIEAELAAGTATLAQAREILEARAQRDSASARRAQAWLAKHADAPAKTAPAPKAPRATGPGSRGGSPAKAARADWADHHYPNGRMLRAGKVNERGTSAWWATYRSEGAKAVEARAEKVLANA